MNIASVHIRNFRKLKNCRIDFGEKETVFIGANNSGKTSAISAQVQHRTAIPSAGVA